MLWADLFQGQDYGIATNLFGHTIPCALNVGTKGVFGAAGRLNKDGSVLLLSGIPRTRALKFRTIWIVQVLRECLPTGPSRIGDFPCCRPYSILGHALRWRECRAPYFFSLCRLLCGLMFGFILVATHHHENDDNSEQENSLDAARMIFRLCAARWASVRVGAVFLAAFLAFNQRHFRTPYRYSNLHCWRFLSCAFFRRSAMAFLWTVSSPQFRSKMPKQSKSGV